MLLQALASGLTLLISSVGRALVFYGSHFRLNLWTNSSSITIQMKYTKGCWSLTEQVLMNAVGFGAYIVARADIMSILLWGHNSIRTFDAMQLYMLSSF